MTDRSASPGLVLLVSVSTLLVFIVVVLSAYIRLGDAGLGCADWPACFGQLGAQDHRSLAAGGPLLPPSAARTFHRIAASLLGLFVLAIAFLGIQRRRSGVPGVRLPLLVLGLTIFLSVLGIVTPSPLVPLVTTGNVLGGMTLLALLWWIGQRLQPRGVGADPGAARRLQPWTRAAIVIVGLQIALGAWSSGNFAGPSCPQLPGCEAARWSAENFSRGFDPKRVLVRDAGGKVVLDESTPLVHMTHRLGALLVLVYLGWLGLQARTAGGPLRGSGNVVLALLALQIALGLGAVAGGLPLWVATLHNAGAAMLLLAVVNLHFHSTPVRKP